MAGEISSYNPNLLQRLRDWYERVAPKNPGQRTLFDISTGPVGALANLTTATEQNNKLAQVLELLGSMPGGKTISGAAGVGVGMIKKADVEKLLQKIMNGDISQTEAKKLTQVLNQPENWQKNFWTDPKTGRNYFYGPDGTLREEVPDYLSKHNSLAINKQDRSYTAGQGVDFPSSYTPEEVSLFTENVVGPYKVTPLNTGSTTAWPATDRYHVKVPQDKAGIYLSRSSTWGKLRGQELKDQIDRFNQIEPKRRQQHDLFTNSILAHELTHVGQFREGMPTGGNTQESLLDLYKYLDPQDKARFKVGQDTFTRELTKDPLMAEIFAAHQPPEVRAEIQKALYKNTTEEDIYETITTILGDKKKKIGVKQNIDSTGLQKDLFQAWKEGKLKGAQLGPIEDFFKLNQKGFKKYQSNIGEVDARMGQARLLNASLKDNPDVYKTHPYSYLDVPAEDVWWKDPTGDTTK